MAKVFFDTNIFGYAVDQGDPSKFETARSLLSKDYSRGGTAISSQVCQEFFNMATKRLKHDPLVVREWIAAFDHEIVDIRRDLILQGIDLSVRYKIAFYDALIVAAAMSARCENLYTEDMQHGMRFGTLQVVNPFRNLTPVD